MESRPIRDLVLYYEVGDEATAQLVQEACELSIDLIGSLWGLDPPSQCRVYVMASWRRVLFHAATWPWRVYLAVTLPMRYGRIRQMWDLAGGWALRYGRRRVVGIKPARLRPRAETTLGERLWVPRDGKEWVQQNTCHELAHACSDHLRLPTWLREGLAMVTVDHLAGKPTVRAETIEMLTRGTEESRTQRGYGDSNDRDFALYLAVRGYWITRYLHEAQPSLLRAQLVRRQSHEALESALSVGLDMELEAFRTQIDGFVASKLAGS